MKDRRTRKGCWKCRERKVKCDERRPSCSACARLSFPCHYNLRLTWMKNRKQDTFDIGTPFEHSIEDWMFINTTYEDLGDAIVAPEAPFKEKGHVLTPESRLGSPCSSMKSESSILHDRQWDCLLVRPISPYSLDSADSHLLDYYVHVLSRQCVLIQTDHTDNHYTRILVPLALSSPDQPLLSTLLAVSANQLRLLGNTAYESLTWTYRQNALVSLRRIVEESQSHPLANWEQVLATTMWLCFFEVSENASPAWLAHARCAWSLIGEVRSRYQLNVEQRELCNLVMDYFASHDAFARTASDAQRLYDPNGWGVREEGDGELINPISGCSPALLDLISETSDLAEKKSLMDVETEQLGGLTSLTWEGYPLLAERHRIEQHLHRLNHTTNPSLSQDSSARLRDIAELKRLAALVHLYARVDDLRPHQAPIPRLASQMVEIIPRVSLQSTTVLWPLFILGVYGAQPDRDDHRKLVLERLSALRVVRQLAHVKLVRMIIESIWRETDLRHTEDVSSWSLVSKREGNISLA